MEKVFRGIINLLKITIIKLRCLTKVKIYPIQPMRIKSQLMIQNHLKRVIIKKNFKLETDAKIRVIDGGTLEIGENCFINCGSYITVMGSTKIGNNCMIGPNVMIFDHDHDYRTPGGITAGKNIIGEIEIGNNVWIGAGCIILKGAKIGDNCVIAAGSIVKERISPKSMYYQKKKSEIRDIR